VELWLERADIPLGQQSLKPGLELIPLAQQGIGLQDVLRGSPVRFGVLMEWTRTEFRDQR
jgi:hypothetical protein